VVVVGGCQFWIWSGFGRWLFGNRGCATTALSRVFRRVSDASSRRSRSTDLGGAGDCCTCRNTVILRRDSGLPTRGFGRPGLAAGCRASLRISGAGSTSCLGTTDDGLVEAVSASSAATGEDVSGDERLSPGRAQSVLAFELPHGQFPRAQNMMCHHLARLDSIMSACRAQDRLML
jgi:hypothetical protein